jgi:hypothetical protein
MSAKLITSQNQFNHIIIDPILNQINANVKTKLPSVKKNIQELVKSLLWADNDILAIANPDSLIAGILGFPRDGQQRMGAVIDRICESIQVTFESFRLVGAQIKGWIKIDLLQSNYADILDLKEASIVDDQNRIEWIKLLLSGDKITLLDNSEVSVLFRPDRRFSRSRQGSALMIKSPSKGIKRIPPEFAGYPDNSVWSRAFTNNDSFITEVETILFGAIKI